MEGHGVRQGFVHLHAIEAEVAARTHFIEIRSLAIEHLAAEIAFHVDAEFLLGHEGDGIGIEIAAEEILAFEAVRDGEPKRAGLGGGAFEFDARAPRFAARGFLALRERPDEFQPGERHAGRAEVAFLAVVSLGVRVAKTVAAQRTATARTGGGFVETAQRFAQHHELDEV